MFLADQLVQTFLKLLEAHLYLQILQDPVSLERPRPLLVLEVPLHLVHQVILVFLTLLELLYRQVVLQFQLAQLLH